MNAFNKYTPLRITLPFISGIISGLNIKVTAPAGHMLLIALLFFLFVLISYYFIRTDYKLRWILGLCATLTLFIIGVCMVTTVDQLNKPIKKADTESLPEKIFLCKIDERPVAKTRTFVGNASLIAKMDSSHKWQPIKNKILVYFKDDSLCHSLAYGDLLMISGSLQAIPEPPNPYMFSFRQYMHNRQVYYQVFVEPGRWQKLGNVTGNPLKPAAEICRATFMETLRKFKIEGQDFALVTALLLGRTEYLEKEIRQEFSQAGAIHVLSVSGLHVGIMYVIADKMLFFLKRGRQTRKLHNFLILVCIWAYAFITGLPSSVIRAALMFSLIAISKMLKRSSESYNILAVAAFFQLCINPFDISQIGFQLSYLAVLGIFAFYEPFNELINPDNKILMWVWSILAVSMAAQLATFPLTSHYFNMFPVYFLITNMVVVPLAAVVTYFAVFLLCIGAFGLTFEWLAWPLKWSLHFMQGSVEMIQSWPGAVIEPIVLVPGQVILIYIVIISLFAYSVLTYRKWAYIFSGSVIVFILLSTGLHFEKLKSAEIIVYQANGNTAIDFIDKRKAIFISDSALINDPLKIDFQIKPNRLHEGVREIQIIEAGESSPLSSPAAWINYPFIYFKGKKIVIIGNQWENYRPAETILCDMAIFSGNKRVSPEKYQVQVKARQIIIDSSVPFYKAEQLMKYFQDEGIPCHSVRHEGAFLIKWS